MLLAAILAGIIGTVIMNLSSETEMAWRGRAASTAPGRATNKVLSFAGVPELDERPLAVLSTWTHYLYGVAWGVYLWLLMGVADLPIAVGGPLFFLGVWLVEQIQLPVLGVAPWSWTWGAKEVAIDVGHHAAYATGTMGAWVLIGVAANQVVT